MTQQAPAPGPEQAAPPPAETAQPAPTPEAQPATAAAQPTPAEPAQPMAAPATAEAAPAPAQPATTESQVAQVVGKEFASYDKDSSGALDQSEFSAWLIALRTASDASFQGDSAESKSWLAQAFTQADTDKNAAVTQAELTTFLTPKPA